MKNYLVSAVRKIEDGWHLEKSQELYKNYLEMYRYSLASFKKFVAEPFEHILWTTEVKNNDEYTVANWYDIKNLWENEKCNIFWAGADTIMIKPTSIFSDRFPEYRLFNFTDPKSYSEFVMYLNDDIQYYPNTMQKEIWDLGEKLWEQKNSHPDKYWGFDQLRHNAMFWEQKINMNDCLHPEMAYQAFAIRALTDANAINFQNQWNQFDINRAHIIHFHASRGSHQVISIMKDICQKLEIII